MLMHCLVRGWTMEPSYTWASEQRNRRRSRWAQRGSTSKASPTTTTGAGEAATGRRSSATTEGVVAPWACAGHNDTPSTTEALSPSENPPTVEHSPTYPHPRGQVTPAFSEAVPPTATIRQSYPSQPKDGFTLITSHTILKIKTQGQLLECRWTCPHPPPQKNGRNKTSEPEETTTCGQTPRHGGALPYGKGAHRWAGRQRMGGRLQLRKNLTTGIRTHPSPSPGSCNWASRPVLVPGRPCGGLLTQKKLHVTGPN